MTIGSPATLKDVFSRTDTGSPPVGFEQRGGAGPSRDRVTGRAPCYRRASRLRDASANGRTSNTDVTASRVPPGGRSKIRSAHSIGTTGAKGRNSSRRLMSRLSRSRISHGEGAVRRLR